MPVSFLSGRSRLYNLIQTRMRDLFKVFDHLRKCLFPLRYIVKLPRVPVADNIPGADVPKFRNLWEHIRKRMPRKGRGKADNLDPLSLPVELMTALEALYGHYELTYQRWADSGIRVPPCFIVV